MPPVGAPTASFSTSRVSAKTGGGFGGCVIGLLPEGDVETAGDAVRRAFADAGFGEPSLFTASAEAGARRA